MRTITTTTKLNLYAFRELDEVAQKKAIYSRVEELASINWDNEEYIPDYVAHALDNAKRIKRNDFLTEDIANYGETDLLLELDEDDEIYTKEGEHYTYLIN